MITADFHTHSTFSTDGSSSLEKMVQAAISAGLKTYCITEHMDYDNHNYQVPSFNAEFPELTDEQKRNAFICNTEEYLKVFLELKSKYSNNIALRFGMELGLQPHLGEYYKAYAEKYPFDFLIGSLHEVGGVDPFYPEFIEGRTPLEAYHYYFEEEIKCYRACYAAFDVLGHLDYALRYHQPENYTFKYEDFTEQLDTLLRLVIDTGRGLECNTGGFSYFKTEPNPRISILKRYRELGGEIITVGSDAHKNKDIAREFKKAEELLKSCGFKYYAEYREHKPIFHKL